MTTGIIFDMDGTLWDSADQVAQSWNQVLDRDYSELKKHITREDMCHVMGKTMDVIAQMLFPELEEEQRMQILGACCENENEFLSRHGGKLYENLEETLKTLSKSYDLYIVSNCQKGYIEAFLTYYNLGAYFKDIECYGNTGYMKGDNIRLVVERNQIKDAIYVGDIQGDYEASKAAGVRFIHAAYGFGTISEKVLAIHGLSELEAVIASMQ